MIIPLHDRLTDQSCLVVALQPAGTGTKSPACMLQREKGSFEGEVGFWQEKTEGSLLSETRRP